MGCTSCGKSGIKMPGKSMPKNWGGMSMKSGTKTTGMSKGSKFSNGSGFGSPKVKMSFSGKRGK